MKNQRCVVLSLSFFLIASILTACGGGNGNNSNGGNGSSTAGQAQGVYSGTSSTGGTFESIILPDDQYYALYGTTSGNTFYINGMMTGQGASNHGSYTATVTDFYYSGLINTGSIAGSYVPGSSITGTVTEKGNSPVTFNGTALPSSSFDYNTTASLSDITGAWTGTLLDGTTAVVTINSNATLSGSDSGCSFSGSVTPDGSGKNFFDVSLTYGGSPCLFPNQRTSGIGIDYLLSDGITRQLLAAVSSGNTYGTVFVASRNSSAPPGTITSVTVTCSPPTIQYGQTSQCSASVSGTGNFSSAVTWSASTGSISTTGLFTAPSSGNASLLVTVTATSVQDSTKSGSTTVTVNPSQQANNVQPIVVDAGPAPQSFTAANEAFVTVTVCVPNTNNCQTVDHVLVDTGSSGLRLLSSKGGGELTLSLPQANDSSGNPLDECLVFLDGYVWGPVATADITVAGEKASSAAVHVVIPSSVSPAPPSSCSSRNPPGGNGNEGDSLMAFGANGILGVGLFQQDCGLACTPGFQVPDFYYDCPASGCNPNPIAVPLAQQVSNPVIFFASDNNGVLIQLPAVPDGGSATVNGSLIFGIGTQANNGLGTANVYVVPDSGAEAGDILTVFPPGGTGYNQSFLDSGSNGIFFLDSNTTGIPMCAKPDNTWYCPTTSPDNLTATNQGQTLNGAVGSPVPVNFAVEDATTLFNNGNNTAFSTLGAPNPGSFDWGLAFFYGRNVFTAIENMSTPGGVGPYYAY